MKAFALVLPLLLASSALAQTQPQPDASDQIVQSQAIIQALGQQRDQAEDQVVMLSAQVALLKKQVAEQKAKCK